MNDGTEAVLRRWRLGIDAELADIAARRPELPRRVRAAIEYSLTGEGKRLRGLLLLAAFQATGGASSVGDAAALAAAVEVVHAYSLVHDDLPCMDNDVVRRGRATTHRAFDVATATVAGVTMVPLAVEQSLRGCGALGLDDAVSGRLVALLMRASGAAGMVGGQLMDLQAEGRALSLAELEAVHRSKTGALITAALAMGGTAAGASDAMLDALTDVGTALGLAFQIADDVLDATGSTQTLGKTAGADAALAKSTYASTVGVLPARARSDALVADAMSRLDRAGIRTPVLERLAHFVATRRS